MLSNKYLIKQPGGKLTNETRQMIMKMGKVEINNDILSTRDNLDCIYHYQPQNPLVINEFNFHDIRVRSYIQEKISNDSTPALIYLHGGGFVGGTLNSLDAACRILADQSLMKIYSLDYHLAPENPFPAALIDSYSFLMNLHKHADVFCIDRNQIFMAGDSAGGNLTLVTALLDSNAYLGTNFLKKIVAFYPPVSCATEGKEQFWDPTLFQTNDDATKELVIKYIHGFLRHSANYDKWYAENNAHNPLVSPFFTTDEQLKALPAAKIIIGEFDGLRVLTQPFAERLMQVNPKVEFSVYNGLVHAFLVKPQIFPEARQAINDALQFLGVESCS